MARSTQLLVLFLLYSSTVLSSTAAESDPFVQNVDRTQFGLKQEKLSHFRLYWHDIITGKNPSAVPIIHPIDNRTRAGFGLVRMIDNPLTQGPDLNSKLLGRAQGLYASASQTQIGLLMAQNFVFIEGKYNGSTITILGRNQILDKVREMPVVGGSGLFRFARGYVQARTHDFNPNTGDATVEYNVYVLHY